MKGHGHVNTSEEAINTLHVLLYDMTMTGIEDAEILRHPDGYSFEAIMYFEGALFYDLLISINIT
jgi:hypothetical protein